MRCMMNLHQSLSLIKCYNELFMLNLDFVENHWNLSTTSGIAAIQAGKSVL